MKIYTIHTPTHDGLYKNHFLPSLPDGFVVHSKVIEQECATGSYYREGWDKTCFRKVLYYKQICEQNQGETYVFSDVDIQFFGMTPEDLLSELGDYDIACQNDTGMIYCSGFWVCKGNERTLDLFTSMVEKYHLEDQTSLNEQIWRARAKFLSHRFFTIGHSVGAQWKDQQFDIPKDILMHHGNWTVGLYNKDLLLKRVREKYNQNQNTNTDSDAGLPEGSLG
jgi:hypothetical protein